MLPKINFLNHIFLSYSYSKLTTKRYFIKKKSNKKLTVNNNNVQRNYDKNLPNNYIHRNRAVTLGIFFFQYIDA